MHTCFFARVVRKRYSMEDYSRYRKNINEGSGSNNVELLTSGIVSGYFFQSK